MLIYSKCTPILIVLKNYAFVHTVLNFLKICDRIVAKLLFKENKLHKIFNVVFLNCGFYVS